MPRSLGIDEYSYGRDHFYADVQAYVRFKTPDVSLARIVDDDDEQSPLTRIREVLEGSDNGDDLDRAKLHHEVRLLGCLIRANLRDDVADVRRKIARTRGHAGDTALADDVRHAIARVDVETTAVLAAVRELRPRFMLPRRPSWIRELYEYLDEYVSISVESYFTAAIDALDAEASDDFVASRRRLTAAVVAEQRHRVGAGYPGVLVEASTEGAYVYRKSALKKFMSSVLFLEAKRRPEGRGIANVIAGIAAAIAMLFSTIAAIWSQGTYGLNSFPFVIAIVISYVFKDRIKEWLRAYISGRLTRWLYDRSIEIHDPLENVVVGRCRESFGFLSAERVPGAVVRLRHADSSSILEPETKPELVMRYVKDVTLNGRQIAAVHRRLGDVNDIIRFNFSSFLVRMDEPVQTVAVYDPHTDLVRRLERPKRYHVNMVMLLHADGKQASVDRFRIILDRRGIQRLQQVDVGV